jgi:hypothetical protein
MIKHITTIAFLGVGTYLLTHNHTTAGGWLLFASFIVAQTSREEA